MSILEGLWLASLMLAGLALAIMIFLIVARLISVRRSATRSFERRRLVGLLLSAPPSRLKLEEVDPASALLTDLAVEILHLVRGEERENFLASAARLGVPDTLRARLKGGNRRTRLAATEALSHFPDALSRSALEEALDDQSSEVRLAAALALASTGEGPDVSDLVARLGIGAREQSLLSVGLLREIAGKKPEQVKMLVLDRNIRPEVRAAAVEALSSSADYSLVSIVTEMTLALLPEDKELPRYLRALGDFGHPAGAKAVMRWLDAPEPLVRAAACEAAGRIGMNEAGDRLSLMLGDQDWWVRLRAGQALVRLGRPGRELLKAVAANGDDIARKAAAVILAEHRSAA